MLELSRHRKVRPRPAFEPRVPLLRVVGLTGLVILATRDQRLAAIRMDMRADIVIGIAGVPQQRGGDDSGLDGERHRISAIGRLFGMDAHEIADRRVCRDDDGLSRHARAVLECRARRRAILDFDDSAVGEDRAARFENDVRQAVQIAQRMKHPLRGKSEHRTFSQRVDGRTIEQFDRRQAGAMRGGELLFQNIPRGFGMTREISVRTQEAAINLLPSDDRLDRVDRHGVTGGRQTCAFDAMDSFQLEVTIVQCIAQVSGGATRFAGADALLLFEHQHLCDLAERGDKQQ